MSDNTAIEWADATWGPTLGCTKVSAGCTNCYAIRTAWRQQYAFKRPAYEGLVRKLPDGSLNWTGKINAAEDRLLIPFGWSKPRRIFVDSQSDLFHEDVPDEFIDRVFAVMALTPWHTYQLLTKRADRLAEYMTKPVQEQMAGRYTRDGKPGTDVDWRMTEVLCQMFKLCPPAVLNRAAHWVEDHYPDSDGFAPCWPLPNVWLGVSVENQAAADERIPLLMETPAAVRFLSCEPLIGPVKLPLSSIFSKVRPTGNFRTNTDGARQFQIKVNSNDLLLHWVIAGGESGPGARPMHPDWARSLRDQCAAAGVAFHFKQNGEWVSRANLPGEPLSARYGEFHHDGEWVDSCMCLEGTATLFRVGKKAAGRLLDGVTHDAFPAPAPVAQP